jgi:hypothetical protein
MSNQKIVDIRMPRILVCLWMLSSAAQGAESVLRVVRDPATGQIDITDAGQPVLRYHYQTVTPPPGYHDQVQPNSRKYAVARSDYIHPLYGPEGEELTLDWSQDHPHHRGIYWAWPEVDFGQQRGDLHALQHLFARPTGKIQLKSGDDMASIVAENRWLWEDKTPIVLEVATIVAHQADSSGRIIDLKFEFTPLVDGVKLARRGLDHYGGLNLRLAPVANLKLIHHADPAGVKPRRAWSAATGTWAGATRSSLLAVLENAANPDYPGDYVEYPVLPWFQPTFPRAGTRYELKKDQPLALQYRLWIHDGPQASQAEYQQQWDRYQKKNP